MHRGETGSSRSTHADLRTVSALLTSRKPELTPAEHRSARNSSHSLLDELSDPNSIALKQCENSCRRLAEVGINRVIGVTALSSNRMTALAARDPPLAGASSKDSNVDAAQPIRVRRAQGLSTRVCPSPIGKTFVMSKHQERMHLRVMRTLQAMPVGPVARLGLRQRQDGRLTAASSKRSRLVSTSAGEDNQH